MTAAGDGSGPELVAVVADADAEKLLAAVIQRGVEGRCLRPLRWVIRRDPMRDASVCQAPLRALAGVRPIESKVLVVFDHHGCGRDSTPAAALEADVVGQLVRAGFSPNDVGCLVLVPELEAILAPAWDRVGDMLAARRRVARPSAEQVRAALRLPRGAVATEWQDLLAAYPKECLDAVLRLLRLRHEPAIFAQIGQDVSLRTLKRADAGARLARLLVGWFGAGG